MIKSFVIGWLAVFFAVGKEFSERNS